MADWSAPCHSEVFFARFCYHNYRYHYTYYYYYYTTTTTTTNNNNNNILATSSTYESYYATSTTYYTIYIYIRILGTASILATYTTSTTTLQESRARCTQEAWKEAHCDDTTFGPLPQLYKFMSGAEGAFAKQPRLQASVDRDVEL